MISMREIELSQDQITFVHDDVYEWVSQWKWYADWNPDTQSFYAKRNVTPGRLNSERRMHRAIWEEFVGPIPGGLTIDHIDHDTLNNDHTTNLRLATKTQQKQNQRIYKNNTSGFKGVSWHNQTKKYRVRLYLPNKQSVSLGLFTDPIEAAHVYDAAALDHFGEFASLNFPEGG